MSEFIRIPGRCKIHTSREESQRKWFEPDEDDLINLRNVTNMVLEEDHLVCYYLDGDCDSFPIENKDVILSQLNLSKPQDVEVNMIKVKGDVCKAKRYLEMEEKTKDIMGNFWKRILIDKSISFVEKEEDKDEREIIRWNTWGNDLLTLQGLIDKLNEYGGEFKEKILEEIIQTEHTLTIKLKDGLPISFIRKPSDAR